MVWDEKTPVLTLFSRTGPPPPPPRTWPISENWSKCFKFIFIKVQLFFFENKPFPHRPVHDLFLQTDKKSSFIKAENTSFLCWGFVFLYPVQSSLEKLNNATPCILAKMKQKSVNRVLNASHFVREKPEIFDLMHGQLFCLTYQNYGIKKKWTWLLFSLLKNILICAYDKFISGQIESKLFWFLINYQGYCLQCNWPISDFYVKLLARYCLFFYKMRCNWVISWSLWNLDFLSFVVSF